MDALNLTVITERIPEAGNSMTVDCYGYKIKNDSQTAILSVNGFPIDPGESHSVGLDSRARIRGRLLLRFNVATGGSGWILQLVPDETFKPICK